MTNKRLQADIKEIAAKLGWSQNKLARAIYFETHDCDNEIEIKQFENNFKKHITRDSTKTEVLEEYLKVIFRLREFEKLGIVMPIYSRNTKLSSNFQKEMKKISKEITLEITAKNL